MSSWPGIDLVLKELGKGRSALSCVDYNLVELICSHSEEELPGFVCNNFFNPKEV